MGGTKRFLLGDETRICGHKTYAHALHYHHRYKKDTSSSIKVLTILTLPLLLEEVELSLLDNMEEASSEKAESELVSWPSAPLGIDRCFRNLISSASELCT